MKACKQGYQVFLDPLTPPHTLVVAGPINGACEARVSTAGNLCSGFDVAGQLAWQVWVVQVVRCVSAD